uniref:Uncharacterized protein n=1 Tax=Anopheles dirus TaxID=7168 RepID=A0A182NWU1_9DIPT
MYLLHANCANSIFRFLLLYSSPHMLMQSLPLLSLFLSHTLLHLSLEIHNYTSSGKSVARK